MPLTTAFRDFLAAVLAGELPSRNWHIASGEKVSEATRGDTALDDEGYRREGSIYTNNQSFQIKGSLPGFVSGIESETISEIGFFSESSAGTMIARNTQFVPFTGDDGFDYGFYQCGRINNDLNTDQFIITNTLITELLGYLSGTFSDYPTHVAFGTYLILDTNNATTGWGEFGQADTIVLNTTNYVESTGSLALIKDGTAGTTFGYSKTLGASVDFTNIESFRLWFRINSVATLDSLASSNALTLRIGSDSSNYYQVQFDRSELDLEWQNIVVAITDMTATGSPDISQIEYLYIALETTNTTTTIVSGEILMDFWAGSSPISATDNVLIEEIIRKAYDSVTRTANEVAYRGFLTDAEGNTYNYYYAGLFDDASAGDMYLVASLFETEKNADVQLNFEFFIQVIFND